MAYPIRISEGLVFTLTQYKKKFWQKWDDINKKFIKSDTWQEGLKPVYQFTLANGMDLELSRDQIMQCLISAFDNSKTLLNTKFVAKSNGKEKLEKRWFVNLAKDGVQYPEDPKGQPVPVNVELEDGSQIPF